VLNLLEVHDVAHLEDGGEPPIEEDTKADPHVEIDEVVPVEGAVVRIDDRNRLRANEAYAPVDVSVVVEDEVAEAGKFSVHWNVRKIQVAAELVVVQRNADAR